MRCAAARVSSRGPIGEKIWLLVISTHARKPERRSRWAARDPSRESLGLPQDSTEQFAGVNLARNADGGYGLEPHYAAQTQRALETGLCAVPA